MDTWLGTVSGKKIDLFNPDPCQITIEDIAHALNKIQRFNGHVDGNWSVLQHSMAVASLVSDQYKLEALLHDATEAYLCDIPSPLKHVLGSTYRDIEERVARAIGERFSIDLVNLPDVVKQADRIMLMTEHERFQPHAQNWGIDYANGLRCETVLDAYYSTSHLQSDFIRVVNRDRDKRAQL